MKVDIEYIDEVGVVRFEGRLDATNARDFKETFMKWNNKVCHFVFDFSHLNFVDSTGLGAVVSCLKSIRENKKELRLVGLCPKVRLVFEITQAHRIFDIYDNLNTAIDTL
ncbi:putative anti-sigma factor antagonist [Spirochaetota bacterium]|nr:putative anti-sigma factor antagonist [Spirochaetota bacterium]